MAKGVLRDRNSHAFEIYSDLAQRFGPNRKGVGYDALTWLGRRNLVRRLVAALVSQLRLSSAPYRILDLGCGNGLAGHELLGFLRRQGVDSRIDGVDFVASNLEMASELFGYERTLLADISHPGSVLETFREQSYDAVFCCEVFQYIHPQDYGDFVNLIHSLLEEEGFFLLVFPNMGGIEKRCYRALLETRFRRQFRYAFDKALVMSLLKASRFSLVSAFGTLFGTPLVMSVKPHGSPKDILIHQIGLLARAVRA